MLPTFYHLFGTFLRDSWVHINREYLRGALLVPNFTLSTDRRRLGYWRRDLREIGIAEHLLLHHSRLEILDVLKHEMAHQYADEVLRSHDERPHGSAFRHACDLLNIQYHARFMPKESASPFVTRIRKLLALAESDNPYEAEAAMLKARSMMEKYELDQGTEERPFCYAYLGEPVKRRAIVIQMIGAILNRFFHVEIIWIPTRSLIGEKRLWLMEANGTRAQVGIAEYVHIYLKRECDKLWLHYRSRHPGVKGATAKREFQVGVLEGFIEKLSKEQGAASNAAKQLIHLKREKLTRFVQARHQSLRKGRALSYRPGDQFAAGFRQGLNLAIRPGVDGQSGEPKLLGSR